MKSITLSLPEVLDFKKYTGILYSTVSLLQEMNVVWDSLELTPEEVKSVKVEAGKIIADGSVTKTIEINPQGSIVASMKFFIENNESDEGVPGQAKQVFSNIISKLV